MKKAILFDLDGTLWDAILPITESWNETMKRNHAPFSFDPVTIKSFMGLTPEETVPLAFPGLAFEEGLALFKKCVQDEIRYLAHQPGALYPQEEEVLSSLKKDYFLGIVSNSDKGYVENYLQSCHMEKHFSYHVCAGDTGLPKWGNILYAAKENQLGPLFYIGDTLKDKKESDKAGVLFVHAAYGFGVIPSCPHRVSALAELPALAKLLL
jgi:phosphoglycolate phosphatase